MRIALRKRYYCDHCKKAGGSSGHMKRHESGCTNNPARICGVCRFTGEKQAPLPELMALVRSKITKWMPGVGDPDDVYGNLEKEGFDALEKAANHCPACILAALRQTGTFYSDFNFRERIKSFWADHNDARSERVYY